MMPADTRPEEQSEQFSYASEDALIASPGTKKIVDRISLTPQQKMADPLPYLLSPQGLMKANERLGGVTAVSFIEDFLHPLVDAESHVYVCPPIGDERTIRVDLASRGARLVDMDSGESECLSPGTGNEETVLRGVQPRFLEEKRPQNERHTVMSPPVFQDPPEQEVNEARRQELERRKQYWQDKTSQEFARLLKFTGPMEERRHGVETFLIPRAWIRCSKAHVQGIGFGSLVTSVIIAYSGINKNREGEVALQPKQSTLDWAILHTHGEHWNAISDVFSVQKPQGGLVLIGGVEGIQKYNEHVFGSRPSEDRVWQYSDHSGRCDDPSIEKVMYGQLAPMDFILADNILRNPANFEFEKDYAWCSASIDRKQQILWLALTRDIRGGLVERVNRETNLKRLLQELSEGDFSLLQDVLKTRIREAQFNQMQGILRAARRREPLDPNVLAETNRQYDYQAMISYLEMKGEQEQEKRQAISSILRTARKYQTSRIAPFFADFLRQAVYGFKDAQYYNMDSGSFDVSKLSQGVKWFDTILAKRGMLDKICQFQNNPLFIQFIAASFEECAVRLQKGAVVADELNVIIRNIELFEMASSLAGSASVGVSAPGVSTEQFLKSKEWIFASHEDKRKILCLAMAMDKTKNLKHRLLPMSLALAHFSQRELEALQSIEQTKWKDRGRDGAALYQKVHLLKRADISYTQEAFGDQEVAFLAALLDAENLRDESGQRLSAKLVSESNIIRDVVLCFDEDERDYARLRYYVGERRTEAVAAEDRIYAFEMPNAIRILQTMVRAINPAAFGERKDSATSVQETAQRIIEEINQRFSSSEDRMLPKNALPLLKNVFDSLQGLNPQDQLTLGIVLNKLEGIEQQLYPLGARPFGTFTPQQVTGKRRATVFAPGSAPATMQWPHRVDSAPLTPSSSASLAMFPSLSQTPSPAPSPVQVQPMDSAKPAEKPAKRPGRLAKIFGGIMMVVGAVLAVTIVGLIPGMIVAGIGAIVYTAGEARAMKAEAAALQEERQQAAVAVSSPRTSTPAPVEPVSSASPQGTATGPEALPPPSSPLVSLSDEEELAVGPADETGPTAETDADALSDSFESSTRPSVDGARAGSRQPAVEEVVAPSSASSPVPGTHPVLSVPLFGGAMSGPPTPRLSTSELKSDSTKRMQELGLDSSWVQKLDKATVERVAQRRLEGLALEVADEAELLRKRETFIKSRDPSHGEPEALKGINRAKGEGDFPSRMGAGRVW